MFAGRLAPLCAFDCVRACRARACVSRACTEEALLEELMKKAPELYAGGGKLASGGLPVPQQLLVPFQKYHGDPLVAQGVLTHLTRRAGRGLTEASRRLCSGRWALAGASARTPRVCRHDCGLPRTLEHTRTHRRTDTEIHVHSAYVDEGSLSSSYEAAVVLVFPRPLRVGTGLAPRTA